ncbi:MAG: tetratricopeptide repeat protein, partial [Syntrophobacterales bacterium]
QAIFDFTRAIEINPRYAEAYFNRAGAYVEKDQYDQAISDLTRVIELDPEDPEAYNNRAVAYYYQGEYDKAWEDVYRAQSLGFQVHPILLNALSEASGRQR